MLTYDQKTFLQRFTRSHVRTVALGVFLGLTTRHIAAILTLCACTPPLDQVLLLWDFLLAFGVHLNVLCVIAQLLLMRDEVMRSRRCVASWSRFVRISFEFTLLAQCDYYVRSPL